MSYFFPLAGDFAIGIVIARPRLMQTIVMENVRSWKVSIEQIREDAMRNLSKNSQPQFKQIEAGIYQTAWDDGYDASRILLPSFFCGIYFPKLRANKKSTGAIGRTSDIKLW
jgi:hypothetical protein